MSRLSLLNSSTRYGVVIDIGSGSVLTAIVASMSGAEQPTVVWAHRERAPLKHIEALSESAKGIITALVSASLKLDGEGRNALRAAYPRAAITSVAIAISAPWCYTVSKTISYAQDEPFEVTKELLSELIDTAERQVAEDLRTHAAAADLGLTAVTRATMDVLTNGYRVANPEKASAQSLLISQATVVGQKYVIDAIEEMHDKLFPKAMKQQLSYMLLLYCTARQLLPNADDVCLVDITYEATEMGILRDGCLQYSTHTAFGLYSLVREIATITGEPLPHVLTQLRGQDPQFFLQALTDTVRTEVDSVLNAYIEKVAGLFHETGDTLSIPKKILLHIDHSIEPFFAPLIEQAAKRATKIDHIVTSTALEIGVGKGSVEFQSGAESYQNDTALSLMAKFFHKPEHCLDFKYL